MHLCFVQATKTMETNSKHSLSNPKSSINGSSPSLHLDMHSTTSSDSADDAEGAGKWAAKLLRECAAAMSDKDSAKLHHLLWMLNELASPYGDSDQKLAAYFLQALFCKATASGRRAYKTLTAVADKTHSFDSLRRRILKFQEASPWTTFGHVASNGALLEALQAQPNLHVIDFSNTLCTQWPIFLEALATRSDDTPRLRLTIVAATATAESVMKEISPRMEKFARLMAVPFEFTVVTTPNRLPDLTKESLKIHDGEAVAVNLVGALRRISVDERKNAIETIRSLNPQIITIVEEEADFSRSGDNFINSFEECLRFYTLYFDMLEESFAVTSNEKLMLERECSRSIVRVLACDDEMEDIAGGDSERRERGRQWSERLRAAGLTAVPYSDDVVDDVKALLKRYRTGWSLMAGEKEEEENDEKSGIYLAWKEEALGIGVETLKIFWSDYIYSKYF